jgi:predicted nuclease with RNAse H fold
VDTALDDVYLGFDPGGGRGFGVAILRGSDARAATVSAVSEAIDWALKKCGTNEPMAAGIDTMLHWSDGPGGWRPADRELRFAYPEVRASILSPNGLYGSMGTGGMALALRLRERWPKILLNETHPKVLAFALRRKRHTDVDPRAAIAWLTQYARLDLTCVGNGHELDAILSAWATREGLSQGWCDLVPGTDDRMVLFPAGTVTYLWPEFPPR